MSTIPYALADSRTMLRRNLRHLVRYPTLPIFVVGTPVVLLLLFVYIFGGTLGAGLSDAPDSRAAYVNYLAPGLILLAVASAAQITPISVAMDLKEGIIARFRTMAISRASVLTGHVLTSMLQTVLAVVVVTAVSVALGFRPDATLVEWLAAAGVVVLFGFGLTWLAVAFGLVAKNPESASNLPMFLMLLPFLGSGFVPTDSMPAGLRWFAEYQPFTPTIETVRGLLMGTGIGNSAVLAVAWGIGLTVLAYLWAKRLYDRRPTRP